MKARAITFVSIVFALLVISPASAHLVTKPKNDSTRAILASQTENLRHAQYVCNNGRNQAKAWHCKAAVSPGWLKDEWNESKRKLRPRIYIKYRSAWLCIHRYEKHPTQGWATNTGNGYYGGLQMDYTFQRTYGPELLARKGTANNWTAEEQMMVAERAHRTRGFYPWPNTARYCGLIR